MHTKVIKNHCFGGPRGLLGGVWGALGAPGRALGAILAPKTQKGEKKVVRCPTPWPPKLEAKSTKNRYDGGLEGIFAEKSATLVCVCEGSCFSHVF